jgi:oligopeptide/dipeptide ABC transporter ATP-binding protein
MAAVLELEGLTKTFTVKSPGLLGRRAGVIRAVDDVTFSIDESSTLALVGETGCGKSTLARCVLRLTNVTSGTIHVAGVDVTHARGRRLKHLWRLVQMVFQDPYSSLNPRRTVEAILSVPFTAQKAVPPGAVHGEVVKLMELVGLDPADLDRFPHEFSGGQRQRIAIARAIALRPRLLVCDEPVSSLDVSIQSQILNLLRDLQKRFGLAYLFISHDMSVVRQMADYVAVMYLGRIVELCDNETLFSDPRHPYTQALLSAIPTPDPRKERIRVLLRGEPPSPTQIPSGCPFHPRCPLATEECSRIAQSLIKVGEGHIAACMYANQGVNLGQTGGR